MHTSQNYLASLIYLFIMSNDYPLGKIYNYFMYLQGIMLQDSMLTENIQLQYIDKIKSVAWN